MALSTMGMGHMLTGLLTHGDDSTRSRINHVLKTKWRCELSPNYGSTKKIHQCSQSTGVKRHVENNPIRALEWELPAELPALCAPGEEPQK